LYYYKIKLILDISVEFKLSVVEVIVIFSESVDVVNGSVVVNSSDVVNSSVVKSSVVHNSSVVVYSSVVVNPSGVQQNFQQQLSRVQQNFQPQQLLRLKLEYEWNRNIIQ
jgi:hypothetical protein